MSGDDCVCAYIIRVYVVCRCARVGVDAGKWRIVEPLRKLRFFCVRVIFSHPISYGWYTIAVIVGMYSTVYIMVGFVVSSRLKIVCATAATRVAVANRVDKFLATNIAHIIHLCNMRSCIYYNTPTLIVIGILIWVVWQSIHIPTNGPNSARDVLSPCLCHITRGKIFYSCFFTHVLV